MEEQQRTGNEFSGLKCCVMYLPASLGHVKSCGFEKVRPGLYITLSYIVMYYFLGWTVQDYGVHTIGMVFLFKYLHVIRQLGTRVSVILCNTYVHTCTHCRLTAEIQRFIILKPV